VAVPLWVRGQVADEPPLARTVGSAGETPVSHNGNLAKRVFADLGGAACGQTARPAAAAMARVPAIPGNCALSNNGSFSIPNEKVIKCF
jgi:hypothetical protein